MFYISIFCKSVCYPLAVSRLSRKQVDQIQGPITPAILNRLGYVRCLPHALVFGPTKYGGLGIPHLSTAKFASQIQLVIRHLRTEGQPGQLAVINMNRLQHSAGVSFSIFSDTRKALPHMEGSWLPRFCESLSQLGATLQIANLTILPPQREHDSYILHIAISHGFSP